MADGTLGPASAVVGSPQARRVVLPALRPRARGAFKRPAPAASDLQLAVSMRGHPLFAELARPQLHRLRAGSRVELLDAGQVLYERGQTAEHFYLVIAGQMKLALHSRGGEEKIVEIIGAGQVFAEAVMFLDRPSYQLTAVAAMPTRVARFSSAEYQALLHENPAVCMRMLGHMSRRLHGRIRDIEHLTFESATDRLVRMLAGRMPVGEDGPVEFVLTESRQQLAAFLSMKPETLSRSLRALIEADAIAVAGRVVRIASRDRLLRQLEAAG